MKPTILLIFLLSLCCSNIEAIRLWNILNPFKSNKVRVLTAGNEIPEKEYQTQPNTPTSESESDDAYRNKTYQAYGVVKKRREPNLVTIDRSFENDVIDYEQADLNIAKKIKPTQKIVDEEAPLLKIKKKPLGEVAKKLRTALLPKITEGFNELSEEGAKELLKIKFHMQIVLDMNKRNEILVSDYEEAGKIRDVIKFAGDIFRYSAGIEGEVRDATTLKNFVKIVVKFYKNCYKDLIFNDCAKAIMKSNLFDLKELCELFEISLQELFDFSCVNDVEAVALRMVNEEIDLFAGVIQAFDHGNEKLGNALTNLIGEIHGTGPDSLHHAILFEFALRELHK